MVGDWWLTGGGMRYTNIHEPIHEYSVEIKYTKYTRASQELPLVLTSLAEHLHKVLQHGQLDSLFPLFFLSFSTIIRPLTIIRRFVRPPTLSDGLSDVAIEKATFLCM